VGVKSEPVKQEHDMHP